VSPSGLLCWLLPQPQPGNPKGSYADCKIQMSLPVFQSEENACRFPAAFPLSLAGNAPESSHRHKADTLADLDIKAPTLG